MELVTNFNILLAIVTLLGIAACLIPVLYRRQIMLLIREGYAGYKEQKKFDELYARLDRNKEGKFSMKEHRKMILAQKKAQLKKNRDAVAERKSGKEK